MADWTTLGVGGPARYFDEVEDPAPSLLWAHARSLPVLLLGQGSNLLVADGGFDGLVVRLTSTGVRVEATTDGVSVIAAAGVVWDELVERAVNEGWAGIECLSGIPGCVGAAPIQNIGAYGQELGDTLSRVRAMARDTGEVLDLSVAECQLGYRSSRFKHVDRDRWVVTEIELALRIGGAAAVRYADIRERLPAGASLIDVRAAVLAVRADKSMVWDPADANRRSAGSFFVNPVVAAHTAGRVVAELGSDAPRYAQPDGTVKLSAAWLIERCGFARGDGAGAVGLSSNHTLAIINRGGARAADIVAFARRVRDGVRATVGVELAPEPVLVGFDAPL